ncbi:MAG: general secretion pathway protein GspK [Verrucomicrobia bacterium]|nr:general secretion pathway protein GspK [Verrucomicrobiota bacterium]MCH8512760.1 general secretion pathway protein GspK [Kiritimatiellia bacterium]
MNPTPRKGSALILALVTIVVLSAMVVSFMYQIQLEGELATHYRFRMKAQSLARAGTEYGKFMLVKSLRPGAEPEEEYGEEFFIRLQNLNRGLAVQGLTHELADGTFTLTIQPESGRRNVNRLTRDDWEAMLTSTGVPEEMHPAIIDCFLDFTDGNDLTRLNGAESDDPFYVERGYEVKNAPIESLDELMLIKGFTRAILHGGTLHEFWDRPEVRVSGIAPLLTVYGDGRINVNTASRGVLMSLPGIREEQVDRLLEGRLGIDGIAGTELDGFRTPQEAVAYANLPAEAAEWFTTSERRFIRVTSIGEAAGVRSGIWVIYEQRGQDLLTVFHREEELP